MILRNELEPIIKPWYDQDFIPMHVFIKHYRASLERTSEKERFTLGILRGDTAVKKVELELLSQEASRPETLLYAERLIKSYLWIIGGDGILLDGPDFLCEHIEKRYARGAKRDFDVNFFEEVFKEPFRVVCDSEAHVPLAEDAQSVETKKKHHHKIGLDLGGSVVKIAALEGDEVVFRKEEPWTPKIESDINYHYQTLKKLISEAREHLSGFDFLGVSSAGIVIDNQVLVSSLFREIPERERWKYQNLLKTLAEEFKVDLKVVNDGEVFALASKTEQVRSSILSLTLGTSTGCGYVDPQGKATNWINELAFVPLDVCDDAIVDGWSKDRGVGVSYLSQDAVTKLAEVSGMELSHYETDALKFKAVLDALKEGRPEEERIFKDMGIYLAYSLLYFREFYSFEQVVLGGGVMAGEHGLLILNSAKETLAQLDECMSITRAAEAHMPTQSVVAADLE